MPLSHAAAFTGLGQRQHVAVVVEFDPGQQRVDVFHHLAVPAVTGLAVGCKERCQLVDFIMRHSLNGHVAHAHLIGVVGSPALERSAVHRRAALHADRGGHADDLGGFEEFLRARNGVVVDDAGRAQAFHPCGENCRRGGIRREGIGGVDVVVDILRHHGWENSCFYDLSQVLQTFFFCGSV